jgi:hypothetical protein
MVRHFTSAINSKEATMSDTLYRIESYKSANSLPRVGAFTVHEAVVVPVEIDYEAADQAAIPMAHRIIFKADVIAIVNAALGIEGGDDDSPVA